ncbi:hypothetical protein [Delftia sp. GW456-R20]|uniref:hypothetical protein n=1 Tax=Delftia sp. GW456-R20 TaxID=1827145 RepID=UPI000ACEC562|nr:hypothetical protein [Delftia sp. GW456-R20]
MPNEKELYRIGVLALKSAMKPEEWLDRRKKFELWQQGASSSESDPYPAAMKPSDIFGWYIFVGELALEDKYALDPSEAARVLPVLTGLAERWGFASRIKGMDIKLRELAGPRCAEPDSGFFEIAVALAYAEKGFDVTFIPEEPGIRKTPDLHVTRGDLEFFIECKRQVAPGEYGLIQKKNWKRLWEPLEKRLVEIGNSVWLKIEFRVELSSIESCYLVEQIEHKLANVDGEMVLLDNELMKVEAKPVPLDRVAAHLSEAFVKVRGTQERSLLGEAWAPPRASMESTCIGTRMKPIASMPDWIARSFWDTISFGCGATWKCVAERSIEMQARDVKALFSRAIEQLPMDKLGIIHIMSETLSGNDVEIRRTKKIEESIAAFSINRPVIGLLYHRIQTESPVKTVFNFDESVTDFWRVKGIKSQFPLFVFLPRETSKRDGGHWNHYE